MWSRFRECVGRDTRRCRITRSCPVGAALTPMPGFAVPRGTLCPVQTPEAAPRRGWPAVAVPPWVAGQLAWLLPAAVAAVVVTYRAARPVPWRDEFASWSAATRTVPEIVALGRHIDGVLVPYYLFLHFWIGWFGDSPAAMRAPSMLAMIAMTAAVAILATRFRGRAAGLLAGLLTAVLPVVSRYGQEARGYAFAALFATVATLAMAAALERPRWWRWVAYALCVLLVGLSHLISLLVVAGHLVAVVVAAVHERRRRPLWGLPAAAAGVGGVLLLTRDGLGQQNAQLNWLSTAQPKILTSVPELLFLSPIVGGAVFALALFALHRGQPTPAIVRAVLLWLTVLPPIGLLFAYDRLVGPIFVGRYLLFAVPLLCVLAGAGLTALRLPVALVAVLVVGVLGLPLQSEVRREHSPFDYRAAAAVVGANEEPGDGIVYAPRGGWQLVDIGLEYYLRGRAPRDVLLAESETQDASLWATECADPAACLKGVTRVWVVAADNLDPAFRADATNQLTAAQRAALRAAYAPQRSWRVDGFTITLFAARPAPG